MAAANRPKDNSNQGNSSNQGNKTGGNSESGSSRAVRDHSDNRVLPAREDRSGGFVADTHRPPQPPVSKKRK